MLSVNDALSYDRDAIGIGRKGTIDRPYILKAPFWTVDTLFYAIPREKVDLNYAFDIFQNIDWKKKDESTGVPSLSKTAINDIDVLAPKHDEQQIIGQFFAAIDNLITLHQRQSFSHSTPDISLSVQLIHPFYTSSWEQRKLTEFVEFFSGLTYTPNDVQENGTLVLRSSNVSNGEVVDADNIYVNPQVVNSENVKVGDIVVVVRNGSRSLIGKHAQIKAFMPNTVIGAFMTGIRSECPEFTNALLNTSRFEEEIAMNMGATINQITGYMFSKMEFKVPCLDEQKKIGEYFEKLDNLITLHQRKGKAAVSGCSNDANNSKGVCCKARDFGYKCHKKDESK